jgi:mannose-6-phosphate isomerase-like protein (cupin superfamily)
MWAFPTFRAWTVFAAAVWWLGCQNKEMGTAHNAPVSLTSMLAKFSEHWAPKKIAEINDYDVKVVKLQGEFTWHRHADTDEFFLVIDGQLTIQLHDGDVMLGPGELFVVPRGVEHCPKAGAETSVMLIEPKGVVNTGDAGGDLTAELADLT